MSGISSASELYKFIRDEKFKLVANIMYSGSPGHQFAELDYFLRKLRCGDISKDTRYLWFQARTAITSTMAELFAGPFRQYNLSMFVDDACFLHSSQILRMLPELGVDVGLSHIKNSLTPRANTYLVELANTTYYRVSNEDVIRATTDYYRTRSLTEDFNPWAAGMPAVDGPLADFLGGTVDRLAVLHFRTNPGNAGVPVPPEHLYPSLEFLRDNNYTIVKVGTEAYPEEFARYGVVNYSESPHRNFTNDIALMANAKLAVVNASGLETIPDLMGIPTVSFGRWHVNIGPYSSKMVVVPTLLNDPVRQRLLTLSEQILVFKTRWEYWERPVFGWHFPYERYTARVPTAEELCAAVREAVTLGQGDQPLTSEQRQLNELDPTGVLGRSKSRVSQFFLESFRNSL